MKQFWLTPAAGKRLIAKAVAADVAIRHRLNKGTVVVIAGTTNGYVVEELLGYLSIDAGFNRNRFFRGVTLPPDYAKSATGRLPDESAFPGDVVIRDGRLLSGKTIFDVVDDLSEGDVVIKGANAVQLPQKRAAVLIGHPSGGTIAVALQAVIGRRVRLVLPIGLEKRIDSDPAVLAHSSNTPGASGLRLWPVSGQVITELDAFTMLTGCTARLLAGGGIAGAEGSVLLMLEGDEGQEQAAEELFCSIRNEPGFMM